MKYFTNRQILNRKLTTRQFFTWTVNTVSDLPENFAFKKSHLVSFSTVKMAVLIVFVFFKRLPFEFIYFSVSNTDIKDLQFLRLWIKTSYNVSHFDLKKLGVTCWYKYFTTCPTLKNCFYSVWDFELKIILRFRFWKKHFPARQNFNSKILQCDSCLLEHWAPFQILQKTLHSRNHVLFRSLP